MRIRGIFLIAIAPGFILCAGCGSGGTPTPGCTFTGFAMEVRPSDPAAPAPDHTAMPSANQELFVAAEGVETGVGPSCIFHPLYHTVPAQWTTSDPQDVAISSAQDATNGLATCLGSTKPDTTVSATVTAYGFTQTLSSPLVCR